VVSPRFAPSLTSFNNKFRTVLSFRPRFRNSSLLAKWTQRPETFSVSCFAGPFWKRRQPAISVSPARAPGNSLRPAAIGMSPRRNSWRKESSPFQHERSGSSINYGNGIHHGPATSCQRSRVLCASRRGRHRAFHRALGPDLKIHPSTLPIVPMAASTAPPPSYPLLRSEAALSRVGVRLNSNRNTIS